MAPAFHHRRCDLDGDIDHPGPSSNLKTLFATSTFPQHQVPVRRRAFWPAKPEARRCGRSDARSCGPVKTNQVPVRCRPSPGCGRSPLPSSSSRRRAALRRAQRLEGGATAATSVRLPRCATLDGRPREGRAWQTAKRPPRRGLAGKADARNPRPAATTRPRALTASL